MVRRGGGGHWGSSRQSALVPPREKKEGADGLQPQQRGLESPPGSFHRPAGCPLLPPPRSPLLPWTLRAAGGTPELYLGRGWGAGGGCASTCWPLGPKCVVWPLSTRGGQRGPTLVQGSDSRLQNSVSLSPKWTHPSANVDNPGRAAGAGGAETPATARPVASVTTQLRLSAPPLLWAATATSVPRHNF